MKHLDRRCVFKAVAAAAGAAALTGARADAAGLQDKNKGKGAPLKTPASLKAEHDELHAEFVRATKAGGKTGEAARAVAKVLHPHFVKEEELAMPRSGCSPTSPPARYGRR